GLAYKPDVDDMRESPSLELIELLKERGSKVQYNDPHIPEMPPTREFPHLAGMKSKKLTAKSLAEYDLVLVSTDHKAYDYSFIVEHANLVVDTRNATSNVKKHRRKIVKA
ncbi:MAG: UDP binding domain-containing protein, partial [Phycisphaerae bacterium]